MTLKTVAALAALSLAAGAGCDGSPPSVGALTYIYGTNSPNVDNGAIVASDPRTGRTTALVTFPWGGEGSLGLLRFDGTTAYYAHQSATATGFYTGTIRSIGLGGGAPTTLISGLDVVDGIALDGDSIYFSDYFIDASFDQSSAVSFIGKAPRGGGPFVKLVDDIPGRAEAVAVGGGFVYWSEANTGTINRVSTAGGDSTVLADSQGVVYAPSLTADDSGVYWVDDGPTFAHCDFPDGSIQYVPAGSTHPVTFVDGLDNPTTVVASAGIVYFTLLGPKDCSDPPDFPPAGSVVQAPEQGGPVVVLAGGLDTPFNLFVRDGMVDYTTTSDYVTVPHAVSAVR